MDKNQTGFPKILSKPIIWDGPSVRELSLLRCNNTTEALANFWFFFSNDELEEKKKDIITRDRSASLRVVREKIKRLKILAKHYDIDTDNPQIPWGYTLCLELCCDKFPGFNVQYENNRGRPKKWDPLTCLNYIAVVDKIKQEKQCGDRQAIRIHLHRLNKKRSSKKRDKVTEKEVRSWEARLVDARNPEFNPLLKMVLHKDGEMRAHEIDQIINIFSTEE